MKKWLSIVIVMMMGAMASFNFVGCGSKGNFKGDLNVNCFLDEDGDCIPAGELDPDDFRVFTGDVKITDKDFYKEALGVCDIPNYKSYSNKCHRWSSSKARIIFESHGVNASTGTLTIYQTPPYNGWGEWGIGWNFGGFVKPAALGVPLAVSISSGNDNEGIDVSVTSAPRAEAKGIRLRINKGKLHNKYIDADLEYDGDIVGHFRLTHNGSHNGDNCYVDNFGYYRCNN